MQANTELTASKLLFLAAGSQLLIGLLLDKVGFLIHEQRGNDNRRISYVVKDAI
jgi:uncharacterized membrane protein YdcZ (DUF606 family)